MRLLTFLSPCLFACILHAADIATWPQWRGPARDCTTTSADWPKSIDDDTLQAVYRKDLGDSYSGPIVTANHVFVTETSAGNETVRALDRWTGDELWKQQWEGSMKVPFFAGANGSWIRSTPAFADGRLFVASMEDVLVALNAGDGAVIWKKDFREEFGTKNQSFGFVCSPIVDGDFVYVQTAAGLIKIDCASGKTIWQSLNEGGGMMGGAFSSPVIATVAGKRQLVVQTRQQLTGVDFEDGNKLWAIDVEAFRGMNILTPTVIGNRIFTSTYGGGSFLFEVTNQDGSFSVSEVWKTKTEGYMSSPVVLDGKIYLHLKNQRFTCIDAATGDALWTTRPHGKYWSMVTNGNQALALDERGELLRLDLNPEEFKLLEKKTVSEQPTWAHLAVAGNQVFVRDLKGLTVYEVAP